MSREGALIGAGSSHIGVDVVNVFNFGPRHADLSRALRVSLHILALMSLSLDCSAMGKNSRYFYLIIGSMTLF